jgi:hypothetical protein
MDAMGQIKAGVNRGAGAGRRPALPPALLKQLRVLTSSPGDVLRERNRAAQVLERLGRQFAEVFAVDSIMWER